MNEDKLQRLWDNTKKLNKNFNMDYDSFKSSMEDKENRSKFYKNLRKLNPDFTYTDDEADNVLGYYSNPSVKANPAPTTAAEDSVMMIKQNQGEKVFNLSTPELLHEDSFKSRFYEARTRQEAMQNNEKKLGVEDLAKKANSPFANLSKVNAEVTAKPSVEDFTKTASKVRGDYNQEVYDRRYLNKDDKPKDTFVKDAFEGLMYGIGEVARIPFKAIKWIDETTLTLDRKLLGRNTAKSGWLSEAANFLGDAYMQQRTEHYRKEKDRYQDNKGALQSAVEGEVGKAVGKAVLGALESAPNLAVSMYTGYKGMPNLGGNFLGASAALSKYDELKDREDLNLAQKSLSMFGAFVAECVPEYLGSLRYGKMLNKLSLDTMKKEIAKEALSKWDLFLKGVAKGYDKIMDWFGEGITEAMTEVMNLTIDKSLGIKDEITKEDLYAIGDAFVIGQISDMPVQGVSLINKSTNKNKIKEEIDNNPRLTKFAKDNGVSSDKLAEIASNVQFGEDVKAEEQELFNKLIDQLHTETQARMRIQQMIQETGSQPEVIMLAMRYTANELGMDEEQVINLLGKETEEMTDEDESVLDSLQKGIGKGIEMLQTDEQNSRTRATQITNSVSHENKYVYEVTFADGSLKEGESAFIIGGNIVTTEVKKKTTISPTSSDDVVIVKKIGADGKETTVQVSPKELELVAKPVLASEYEQVAYEQDLAATRNMRLIELTMEKLEREENAKQEVQPQSTEVQAQAQEITTPDVVAGEQAGTQGKTYSNGQQTITASLPDANGVVTLSQPIEVGGEVTQQLPQTITDENGTYTYEQVLADLGYTPQQPAQQGQQPAQQGQQASSYPMTADGKVDWSQMDANQSMGAILERNGNNVERAKQYAERQVQAKQKALEEAKKAVEQIDIDDDAAYNAALDNVDKTQAEVDKWTAVANGIDAYNAPIQPSGNISATSASGNEVVTENSAINTENPNAPNGQSVSQNGNVAAESQQESGNIQQNAQSTQGNAENVSASAENAQQNAENPRNALSSGRNSVPLQREAVQDFIDSINSGHQQVKVWSESNIEEVLRDNHIPESTIRIVLNRLAIEKAKGNRMNGFIIGNTLFLNYDLPTLEDVRSAYVHERQHGFTTQALKDEVNEYVDENTLEGIVRKLCGTNSYDKSGADLLADEFISMAMEVAYRVDTDAELVAELSKAGANEELINIIKRINDEQRTSNRLARARRNSNVNNNGQENRRQDGRNSQQVSEGILGQEAVRPFRPSTRRDRSGRPSETSQVEPTLESEGFEVDDKTGDAKFSVAYRLDKNQIDILAEQIAERIGVSKAKAKKWLKAETSLAALCMNEDNVAALYYFPDGRYGAIKSNSDYPQGTVDFNNICRKRLDFTNIYLKLQREFPNKVFTAKDLETIRQIMIEDGLEVACGLCYVEDRRQLLGEIANEFREFLKDRVIPENLSATKKEMMQKVLDMVGDDTHIPTIYELLEAGAYTLRESHPNIFEAFVIFNNNRGMMTGRLFEGYAEYKREILDWDDKKVKKVNDAGGLRIFSFSDFEAHHLIDIVQVISDAAARGVMIQGYTKVPEFAKAIRNTKVKLNRSLIPLGDTGIQEVDGKKVLTYDPVEGIDVNSENFLDESNNPNVGNVLVGINDEQIRMAMEDANVDYIIPFHTGLKKDILLQKKIGDWVNYKNSQTEKDAATGSSKTADGKKVVGVNIYTDVLQAAEKAGTPITNRKEFVEYFLQVCKERGLVPRFEQFLARGKNGEYRYTKGYEKLLVDFKMFDKRGRILPQEPVVPIFDDAFNQQIIENYVKGTKETKEYEGTTEKIRENLDLRYSISAKEQQLEIINATNPMQDDVHTGIRSVEDIHTLAETMSGELLVTTNDWSEEDIQKAIDTNKVTLYSSKPIKNGVFVTPSKMIAQDYAGNGQVYEQTTSPDNVAWIDSSEGQYADVRFSIIGEKGAAALDQAEEATTRLDNLAVAREMESANKDAKTIRMATGWERGADGKWRYEIEDVKLKGLDWINQRKQLMLKDIVDAEELFKAYPQLADIKIKKSRAWDGASYSSKDNTIEIKLGWARDWMPHRPKDVEIDLNSTLVHEVQHAIQKIEGFARGGNSTMLKEGADTANSTELRSQFVEVATEYNNLSPLERATDRGRRLRAKAESLRSQLKRELKQLKLGKDGYRKLAGEVEARNASKRIDMSAEQKLNTLLKETEDVAREDQIFMYRGVESQLRNEVRFSISNNNQRIFISNAEKAVESIKQDKATPQQWKAMIEKQGGLKAGEDKWLGLSEWLDEKAKAEITPQANETRGEYLKRANKTITKQEILDFIAKNQIQIEEVEYGENAISDSESFQELNQEFYELIQEKGEEREAYNAMVEKYGDDFRLAFYPDYGELQISDIDAASYFTNAKTINDTRLDYTTAGLENNHEIALTVPTIESWNESDEIHFGDAGEGRAIAWIRFGETQAETPREVIAHVDELQFAFTNANGRDVYTPQGSKFSKDYAVYGKLANGEMGYVLYIRDKQTAAYPTLEAALEALNAHYEANPRKVTEYDKVLVIDEIQSKRHQEGREKGYSTKKNRDIKKKIAELTNRQDDIFDTMRAREEGRVGIVNFTEEETAELKRLGEEIKQLQSELSDNNGIIPEAPFEKNWHELAFKRMLRYAAENGFDKVAWTTGTQQAERYNIGGKVERINASLDNYSATNGWEGEDRNRAVSIYLTNGNWVDFTVDKSGIILDGEYIGNSLESVVGKEIAKKIMDITPEQYSTSIEGADLRIGGEGMKGFYDKMLPSFVSKYVKKWGAKVGEVTMPQLQEGYQTMHSVDITPEMKESVMEGQPMFSISAKEVATDIWNKYQYDGELESVRDVAEYVEEHMPKNAQTQALFDAIDAYRIEEEEDRMYYGMRGDLEPFEDAILDEVEKLMGDTEDAALEEEQVRYSIVTDEKLLEELENGETIKVYRAMQLRDGKLYPPMSGKADGEWRNPIELGVWEQAEETPDKAVARKGKDGKVKYAFKLDKGNKKSLYAAYNPYIHTSRTPLNDQFSEAQDRPELVTVEVEVPVSELTSAYKAEKAKDAVGELEWKAGVVQGQLTGTRKVILSRYDKPIRIVPEAEVADRIVEMIDGKDVVFPSNVVTPQLRQELEDRGVEFRETDNQGNPRFSIKDNENLRMSGESVNFANDYRWGDKMLDADYIDQERFAEELELFEDAKNIKDELEAAEMKAYALMQFYDKIADSNDKPIVIPTYMDVRYYLTESGMDENTAMAFQMEVIDAVNNGDIIKGVHYNGKIAIIGEFVYSLIDSQSTYAHELQHKENKRNADAVVNAIKVSTPQELVDFVNALQGDGMYDDLLKKGADGFRALADEAIAFGVQYGYRLGENGNLAEALRDSGLTNEKLINIITQEYERQKESHGHLVQNNREGNSRVYNRNNSRGNRANGAVVQGESKQVEKPSGHGLVQSSERTRQEVARSASDLQKLRNEAIKIAYGNLLKAEPMRESGVRFSVQSAPVPHANDTKGEFLRRYMAWRESQLKQEAVDAYKRELKRGTKFWRQFVKKIADRNIAIEKFQEFIVKRGGAIGIDTNAFFDTTMAAGRAHSANEMFRTRYEEPLLDLVTRIVRSKKLDNIDIRWNNIEGKNNGTKLTASEIIGIYCQAKDVEEAAKMGLPDRGAEGFLKNLTSNGKPLSHTDVISMVENALAGTGLKKQLWKAIRRATKFALDYQLKHKFISRETYNEYRSRKYYVPERGWRERDMEERDRKYVDSNGNEGDISSPFNAALMKAKGRESLASDPFAYIFSIGYSTIAAVEKNNVKQKFLNFLLENEKIGLETGAWKIKEVYVVNVYDENGNVISEAITYEKPSNPDDIVGKVGNKMDTLKKLAENERKQHAVSVLKNGKEYLIFLEDEKVANALNRNYEGVGLQNTLGWRIVRGATGYYSGQLTQYNPEFAVSNVIRDYLLSQISNFAVQDKPFTHAFLFHKNLVGLMPELVLYVGVETIGRTAFLNTKKGKYMREYFALGAQTGFSYLEDVSVLRDKINEVVNKSKLSKVGKAAPKALLNTLSALTELSELSIRMTQYITCREKGMSSKEAAIEAKEITTNFDRKGEWSSIFSGLWSFFNAGIQGTNKIARDIKRKPARASIVYASFAALLFYLGYMWTMANPDDPEEEEWWSDYTRQMYFTVGDTKVPMLHFFRMFWGAGTTMALKEQGEMSSAQAAGEYARLVMDEVIPQSPLQVQNLFEYSNETDEWNVDVHKWLREMVPSSVKPIFDLVYNEDFMGRPISKEPYSKSEEGKYKAKKYERADRTPESYIKFADMLSGGNPKELVKGVESSNIDGLDLVDINGTQLQHFVEGYTKQFSIVFDLWNMVDKAIQGEELETKDKPFIRKFKKEFNGEGAYKEEYWELKRRLDMYKTELDDAKKNNKDKYDAMRYVDPNAEERTYTEKYDLYKKLSKLVKDKPEDGKEYNAEEVKQLMEANRLWMKIM